MKKSFVFVTAIVLMLVSLYMPAWAIDGDYYMPRDENIEIEYFHTDSTSSGDSYNNERILIKVIDGAIVKNSSYGLFMYGSQQKHYEISEIEASLSGKYGISELKQLVGLDSMGNFSANDMDNVSFNLFGSLKNDKHTWYMGRVEAGKDILTAVEEIVSEPWIVAAEPDYIFKIQDTGIPNISTDPGMAEQWHIEHSRIREAWEYLDARGFNPGGRRDVVVAVIDTGVDYTHLDLKNNMWVNPDEVLGNGIDDDGNGYIDDIHGVNTVIGSGNPMDFNGHGTHIAGIIAAVANNYRGGVGAAFNVQLMAINAFQNDVLAASDIVKGIEYAIDKGADVINMSFGGSSPSLIIRDALQIAHESMVLVAAAGNEAMHNEPSANPSGTPLYPASYPWVIGVMAQRQYPATNGDNLADFSNWDFIQGNSYEYEVMAPGVSIFSTYINGMYAKGSGTSMATPVVAGIAALVRSVHADKNKYNTEFIMERIITTGESKRGITYKFNTPPLYYREVNALNALSSGFKIMTIDEAIEAIDHLVETDVLSLRDRTAVENARELVETAKDEGATDNDITNLNKLIEAESRIQQLLTMLNEALQAAEQAIENLPNVISLDDEEDIIEARALVNMVFELDEDVQLFQIEKLEAAETAIILLKEQKAGLEIIEVAEAAVTAYETAPITTLAEIEVAKALESEAIIRTALVQDVEARVLLEGRISKKKAMVEIEELDLQPVIILDMNLRSAIQNALGRGPDYEIINRDTKGLKVLDAFGNGITDLTGLENFTGLQILRLYNNNITDITPLAQLTEMGWLHLNGNNIEDISPLSGLNKLILLRLSNNNITDIGVINNSNMPRLGSLFLDYNSITNIASLEGYTALTRCDLRGNLITDYTPTTGFYDNLVWKDFVLVVDIVNIADPNLEVAIRQALGVDQDFIIRKKDAESLFVLDAFKMGITDLSGLENFTNLYLLRLYGNDISDLTPLAQLHSIAYLHLNENSISNISPLSGLTNLVFLQLSNNNISNIGAINSVNMPKLGRVYLVHNNITSIASLTGFTALTRCDLAGNPIADYSPATGFYDNLVYRDFKLTVDTITIVDSNLAVAIKSALGIAPQNSITRKDAEKLLVLDAFNSGISNLSGLEHFTNLVVLRLYSNSITDITPLAQLLKLQNLHLHNNCITDIGPLAGLSALTLLNLNSNNINDIDIITPANMPKLVRLYAGYNNITSIASLSGYTNLTRCELRGNPIIDWSPVEGFYHSLILPQVDLPSHVSF